MDESMVLFTRDEVKAFFDEFGSKLRAGVRSPTGLVYSVFVLGGVGWASFAIPVWNGSVITPETLGIYVVGILVTVMADGLMIWRKGSDENRYEQAIAVSVIVLSVILLFLASLFSTKSSHVEDSKRVLEDWRCLANPALITLLILATTMSLVLTGFDPSPPSIGALDRPTGEIKDRISND